jgi:hypothetical protein
MTTRTQVKAGAIRRRIDTTARPEDRLALLVVRAGLKAGARASRLRKRGRPRGRW